MPKKTLKHKNKLRNTQKKKVGGRIFGSSSSKKMGEKMGEMGEIMGQMQRDIRYIRNVIQIFAIENIPKLKPSADGEEDEEKLDGNKYRESQDRAASAAATEAMGVGVAEEPEAMEVAEEPENSPASEQTEA